MRNINNENKSTIYNSVWNLNFLLFTILLILKLVDKINWSWWIVTLPLWIGVVISISIIIILLVVVLVLIFINFIYNRIKSIGGTKWD